MRRALPVFIFFALIAGVGLGIHAWAGGAAEHLIANPIDPAKAAALSVALAVPQARVAVELIGRLADNDKKNVVVSPASVASALAVVAEGADSRLKTAILASLGLSADAPEKALAALHEARASLAVDNGELFAFADRLLLASGLTPAPELAARLEALGAKPANVDFSNPAAIEEIDGWINETTRGAIPYLLRRQPLHKVVFVALNALYYKGKWRRAFDAALTRPASFTGADGEASKVDMMQLKAPQAYRAEGSFVGVDLPFRDRFSLVVVTTADKPAKAAEFSTVAKWLTGAGYETRAVDLRLPRFKLDGGPVELLPALDAMGVGEARRDPEALRAFGANAALDMVLQRAVVEVDEEGATAAAVTAAVAARGIPREAPKITPMTVDKPFVFALRDGNTGLILVAGYVARLPVNATRGI
ncbi:serpin family protein [Methylocystis echinoides]|uniref:serpin family protein n=1 Tax=Methylocystis echinoides TaxID=29468 RepID=UPI00342F603F